MRFTWLSTKNNQSAVPNWCSYKVHFTAIGTQPPHSLRPVPSIAVNAAKSQLQARA
jgi:hypothetical protein